MKIRSQYMYHIQLVHPQRTLALEMRPSIQELLAHNDSGAGTIACWTTLKFRQWEMNHGRLLNLLKRVDIPKLRIWVL